MTLLRRFLPEAHFSETQSIVIRAPAATVLDAVAAHDPSDDWFIGALVALRELPNRVAGAFGLATRLKRRPRFGLNDFLFLGREADREIVFGLVGRFWMSDYGLVVLRSAEEFAAFHEPGVAKLALSFRTEAQGNATRLTTTTEVYCTDEASRQHFRPYWWLILPVSGLIRRRILVRIKAQAERPVMGSPAP